MEEIHIVVSVHFSRICNDVVHDFPERDETTLTANEKNKDNTCDKPLNKGYIASDLVNKT